MPGDVLMVAQQSTDKVTGKSFTWRWFGVVRRPRLRQADAIPVLHLTHDRFTYAYPSSREMDITLLEEEHWPDGVRALRLRAILEGRIDLEA